MGAERAGPQNVFCISRDIFDHSYVGAGNAGRDPWTRMEAWEWLVSRANYRPSQIDVRGETVTLGRGQLVVTQEKLAQRWKWTRKQVRTFLDGLQARSMIGRETGTPKGQHQTLVTISNYEIYQFLEAHLGPPKRQPKGHPRATQGPQSNTVNKENKNNTHTEGDLFDEVEAAFADYNAVARQRGLTVAGTLSSDRRRALRARLDMFGGLEGWRKAMKILAASAFLCGQTGGTFRADLTWLIAKDNAEKFRKLVEGGYGNGQHAGGTRPSPEDDIPEFVRAAEAAKRARTSC
jgi:hypothetical protein